jgi:hypothetical protein
MQRAYAVLHCHLWPVWLYHIFAHYPINGTIFGKKVIEHQLWIPIFCTTFVETFLILRRMQRDIIVSIYMSLCKVPVILVRLS